MCLARLAEYIEIGFKHATLTYRRATSVTGIGQLSELLASAAEDAAVQFVIRHVASLLTASHAISQTVNDVARSFTATAV
jgi:hypothetical protein